MGDGFFIDLGIEGIIDYVILFLLSVDIVFNLFVIVSLVVWLIRILKFGNKGFYFEDEGGVFFVYCGLRS